MERAPNKAQIVEDVTNALRATSPQLVEPPWRQLLKQVKYKWGPPDSDWWSVYFLAPAVGTQISMNCFGLI